MRTTVAILIVGPVLLRRWPTQLVLSAISGKKGWRRGSTTFPAIQNAGFLGYLKPKEMNGYVCKGGLTLGRSGLRRLGGWLLALLGVIRLFGGTRAWLIGNDNVTTQLLRLKFLLMVCAVINWDVILTIAYDMKWNGMT